MFVTIAFVEHARPVSRRERPAKPALSREGIVAVAVRVMREEGLERVSMRRLASELDTGPASLYVYVRSAADLHGAIFDELLGNLALPDRVTARTWRAAVVRVLVDYTLILFGQPSLARSVLLLRPSGPRYLGLVDWLLQALRAGGVPVQSAAWGIDLLLAHATAAGVEHGTRNTASDAAAEASEQAAAVLAADANRYPGLAWAQGHLFVGSGLDRLRWRFEAILSGIVSERAR